MSTTHCASTIIVVFRMGISECTDLAHSSQRPRRYQFPHIYAQTSGKLLLKQYVYICFTAHSRIPSALGWQYPGMRGWAQRSVPSCLQVPFDGRPDRKCVNFCHARVRSLRLQPPRLQTRLLHSPLALAPVAASKQGVLVVADSKVQ